MKLLLSFIVFFSSFSSVAQETSNDLTESIVGKWKYVALIYRGNRMPPATSNLRLYFVFNENGDSQLYWFREGERGFCDRKGQYQYTDGQIHDHITWVNPNNSRDCANDPDMQLNKRTSTPAQIVGNELHLQLFLGDEPLYYVLELQDQDDKALKQN